MSHWSASSGAGEVAERGVCPRCRRAVAATDPANACPDCGAIHHRDCWMVDRTCHHCAVASELLIEGKPAERVLRISENELDRAVPLRIRQPEPPSVEAPRFRQPPPANRTSRLAIAAFVVAVAGIPLFGLATGVVAVVLGIVALQKIRHAERGAGLAACGIALGTLDVIGWIVALAILFSNAAPAVDLAVFEPDPKALDDLPPHLQRAMRANVLIHTRGGGGLMASSGIGSGVILRIAEGTAYIVTNRHVVDHDFDDNSTEDAVGHPPAGHIEVKLLGQAALPGQVLWIAPDGIDLAVVSVPVASSDVRTAPWDISRAARIGDDVFAIGNPHGLGWSHTQGAVSQFRVQPHGARSVRVIQATAAINPGNSGGGLYDHDGRLIGINTWTKDKRVAEGLGFSIALETLVALAPPIPQLGPQSLPDNPP